MRQVYFFITNRGRKGRKIYRSIEKKLEPSHTPAPSHPSRGTSDSRISSVMHDFQARPSQRLKTHQTPPLIPSLTPENPGNNTSHPPKATARFHDQQGNATTSLSQKERIRMKRSFVARPPQPASRARALGSPTAPVPPRARKPSGFPPSGQTRITS